MDFVEVASICALLLRSRRDKPELHSNIEKTIMPIRKKKKKVEKKISLQSRTIGKRRKKKYWVHPTNNQRLSKGHFYTLYEDLRTDPQKFSDYFKMSPDAFDDLLAIIRPDIAHQNTNMRQCVPPEERLAVTLRYLSTGSSYSGLRSEYLLGLSTVHNILIETCQALWNNLTDSYMPENTTEDWVKAANDFYTATKFPNCAAVIDGRHIRIANPETGSCKQFFSKVLVVLVDADHCFTAVDVGPPRTLSDSNVFKSSAIVKKLDLDQLKMPQNRLLPNDDKGRPMPFVVLGGNCLALSDNILRPYTSPNRSDQQRVFNRRLAKTKRISDSAFNVLAYRWKIFNKPMNVKPEFCHAIIKACCILHNYVNKKDCIRPEELSYSSSMPNIHPVGVRGTVRGTKVRDYFTSYFNDMKNLSKVNSKKVQKVSAEQGSCNESQNA